MGESRLLLTLLCKHAPSSSSVCARGRGREASPRLGLFCAELVRLRQPEPRGPTGTDWKPLSAPVWRTEAAEMSGGSALPKLLLVAVCVKVKWLVCVRETVDTDGKFHEVKSERIEPEPHLKNRKVRFRINLSILLLFERCFSTFLQPRYFICLTGSRLLKQMDTG